jgi:preprotein translocase subunit SecF
MTENTEDVDITMAETADVDAGEFEAIDLETIERRPGTALQAPQHSFFTRLYTGTGAFEVVGRRKLWFGISFLIVGLSQSLGNASSARRIR